MSDWPKRLLPQQLSEPTEEGEGEGEDIVHVCLRPESTLIICDFSTGGGL